MTSDGDALFRAICEQPWEDTPRLMYADWLQENGVYRGRANPDEARLRAAFIRHQIAMVRGDHRAVAAHPALMFGTFRGCVERWAAELPRLPGVTWHSQFFHRGFVSGASFDVPAAYPAHAANVFAAAPIARACFYQMTAEALAGVLDDELLRRVAALDVSGRVGDDGAFLIARSPNLVHLTELRLVGVGMTDAGLEALANAEGLAALETFSFDSNQITDRGVVALLGANALGVLKTIGWMGNSLSRKAVLALRKRYRDIYTGPLPG